MKKLKLVSGDLTISIAAELNEDDIPILQVGRIRDESKIDLNTGDIFLAKMSDDILSIEFKTIEGVDVWLHELYEIRQHLTNKV